ncbi:MAG: hypothetical protein H0X40_12865 [Chthoniobacterales bacterium]|nr:hypothetical protein [Chthoniobacterales bacterium]
MRKLWLFLGAGALLLLVVAALATAWLNPRLTKYVESDSFRDAMEKETAKGLHFPRGQFTPIHRTGFLTAKFNPLGIFLRRWQLALSFRPRRAPGGRWKSRRPRGAAKTGRPNEKEISGAARVE